jgi:hypothetical protein
MEAAFRGQRPHLGSLFLRVVVAVAAKEGASKDSGLVLRALNLRQRVVVGSEVVRRRLLREPSLDLRRMEVGL